MFFRSDSDKQHVYRAAQPAGRDFIASRLIGEVIHLGIRPTKSRSKSNASNCSPRIGFMGTSPLWFGHFATCLPTSLSQN